MRFIYIFYLIWLSGCATKYIVPGNRFLTPESQGGIFRGQAEFQQTMANQLRVVVENGSVKDGVVYSDTKRSGFLVSESILNSFDLVWSHTGTANSLFGGKFQLLGGSRIEKQTGHKLALGALFGGNNHETEDKSFEFTLSGREFLLLYGYRLSENILPYASLSVASYKFQGTLSSSDPITNGLKPDLVTDARTLSGGFEFSFESFFAKFEGSYQQLTTTDTKSRAHTVFGYSIGYSW